MIFIFKKKISKNKKTTTCAIEWFHKLLNTIMDIQLYSTSIYYDKLDVFKGEVINAEKKRELITWLENICNVLLIEDGSKMNKENIDPSTLD